MMAKQTLPVIDGLLAATAFTHRLTVAIRNVADFKYPGLKVVNPFTITRIRTERSGDGDAMARFEPRRPAESDPYIVFGDRRAGLFSVGGVSARRAASSIQERVILNSTVESAAKRRRRRKIETAAAFHSKV